MIIFKQIDKGKEWWKTIYTEMSHVLKSISRQRRTNGNIWLKEYIILKNNRQILNILANLISSFCGLYLKLFHLVMYLSCIER